MSLPIELFQAQQKTFKAQILEFITLKDYKIVEIEARVGKIMNKITKKRIDYHTNHPIIFTGCPNEFYFESGVNDEKDFRQIKETISNNHKLMSITDKITMSNNIRKVETFNDKNIQNPSVVKYEKKEKIKNLDIYLPNYKYDVRISVSTEQEVEKKDFNPSKSQFSRIRNRESLGIGPFSFDFTVVSKPNDNLNKIWEIELEIIDYDEGLKDFSEIIFSLPILRK